ncbi:hypothetical protein BDR06DRAFT_678053 [Suillus hirtellus]|nr:hypothetical protein BDR06DRAFT_678053 [Suillus hirtellus]
MLITRFLSVQNMILQFENRKTKHQSQVVFFTTSTYEYKGKLCPHKVHQQGLRDHADERRERSWNKPQQDDMKVNLYYFYRQNNVHVLANDRSRGSRCLHRHRFITLTSPAPVMIHIGDRSRGAVRKIQRIDSSIGMGYDGPTVLRKMSVLANCWQACSNFKGNHRDILIP